ncbi:uncharacterized protein PG986_011663 [Apiospora aurea]|uniref:Uncharacterized protein n=1 Tax=Apiospora aurea TaxID=335848 RepID=A0ABR1PXS5_9PEZI
MVTTVMTIPDEEFAAKANLANGCKYVKPEANHMGFDDGALVQRYETPKASWTKVLQRETIRPDRGGDELVDGATNLVDLEGEGEGGAYLAFCSTSTAGLRKDLGEPVRPGRRQARSWAWRNL